MDLLELEPLKKKPEKKNLEEMSLEALQEYIDELEAEISRVREIVSSKESAREGAESVFKK